MVPATPFKFPEVKSPDTETRKKYINHHSNINIHEKNSSF